MPHRLVTLIPLLLAAAPAADPPAPHMGARPEPIFADDFKRETLGEAWQTSVRSFAITDGALTGGMCDGATHPAIAKVPVKFQHILLRFAFRMDGANNFNVVFNDIDEKSAHSGHIARVTVSSRWVTLMDDKVGLMSNEWVTKRNDPAFKQEVDAVRAKTSRRFTFQPTPGQWHTMVIENVGDEMLVSIDARLVGHFRSAGFSHPTKTSFHWSVSGRDVSLRQVRAWRLEPDPSWGRRRERVVGELKPG